MEISKEQKNKQVALWLMLGVFMLIIQILLGGITRLTGSGLSITEWQPLLGIIPPTNEQQWLQAFQQYQEKTGQYKYLNSDFGITQFKFIYFWEWFHRAWARLIGVAFIIPFIYFLIKKHFNIEITTKLISLFLLGVAQGLIGWIMVKSGLNDENLYVSHIRLAIHFISALILVSFTFWYSLSLLYTNKGKLNNPKIKKTLLIILILLTIQLTYGAFMAGLKAATAATTWPSINGSFFPTSLLNADFINDKINIHFIHRNIAYLLLILILYFSYQAKSIKTNNLFNKIKNIPLYLVLLQILLGIVTIIYSNHTIRNGFGAFEYFAQAHQLIAMFLLLSILASIFFVTKTNK